MRGRNEYDASLAGVAISAYAPLLTKRPSFILHEDQAMPVLNVGLAGSLGKKRHMGRLATICQCIVWPSWRTAYDTNVKLTKI